MNYSIIVFGLTVSILIGVKANAEDAIWPCIQRRVEALSIGQMWGDEVKGDVKSLDANAVNLAQALSLRRVDLLQSEALIDEYVSVDDRKMQLGIIFSLVLEKINKDRSRIISGIENYAKNQKERAENIEKIRNDIDVSSSAKEPNFDEIDALEEKLDWETKIYNDREDALSAVCETPVNLEKRAYAIAKLLQTAK